MSRYSANLWRSRLFLTVDLNAMVKTLVGALADGYALDDIAHDWPPALIEAAEALMTKPSEARPSRH